MPACPSIRMLIAWIINATVHAWNCKSWVCIETPEDTREAYLVTGWNRSMRYDGYVREMPSAGQLILGTTPRDDFLLELGPPWFKADQRVSHTGHYSQGQRIRSFDLVNLWPDDCICLGDSTGALVNKTSGPKKLQDRRKPESTVEKF